MATSEINTGQEFTESKEHLGPILHVRGAEAVDIPDLIRVERERYQTNYDVNPKPDNELYEMFSTRLSIAKDWMMVVELDGEVEGFTTGMPTSERQDDFVSWEKSTNNGTLEGTFDANGRNVYVVNLDVSRKGTKHEAQFELMARLGEKCIEEGKDRVIFVSRMPEFSEYVTSLEATLSGFDWSSATQEEKDAIAQDYVNSKKLSDEGHMVREDRLLRFYEEDGFCIGRLIPNGFEDPESLDYGVLCTGENPIPERLRDNRAVRRIGAWVFRTATQHPELMKYVIK